MTSQQDTELEKILIRYRSTADAAWSEVKDGFYTQEEYEVALRKISDEAIQALTSWKDKEVEKAKLRLINTEIRKLQKNEVWYRFDDCVWELKQTRKRITKSLQSQGGK